MRSLKASLWLAVSALLACPLPTLSQNYPEKNIRMVVAYATGPSYTVALLLADKLRESFGQTFVPDFDSSLGSDSKHRVPS